MKSCPSCGHQSNHSEVKCPACGFFYKKIAELIAEQEAAEQLSTLGGRLKKIFTSSDIKNGLLAELRQFRAGLSKKGVFTLYVITAFVFALVLSVL